MTVDDVLERIRAQLVLEADAEYEILEEVRGHLEDAAASARARGLDEGRALMEAAARFGGEEVARELQAAHAGWGTADGVIAAGLPVLCALMLRWLVFAPGGTAVGWREALTRPAFWGVAVAALVVPILRFPRWRHALACWVLFWGLSVVFFLESALRW